MTTFTCTPWYWICQQEKRDADRLDRVFMISVTVWRYGRERRLVLGGTTEVGQGDDLRGAMTRSRRVPAVQSCQQRVRIKVIDRLVEDRYTRLFGMRTKQIRITISTMLVKIPEVTTYVTIRTTTLSVRDFMKILERGQLHCLSCHGCLKTQVGHG